MDSMEYTRTKIQRKPRFDAPAYDLMQAIGIGLSPYYFIQFDIYKPRPHFLVLLKEPYRHLWKDFQLFSSDALMDLVRVSVAFVRCLELDSKDLHPYLSIRRGAFRSMVDKFIGHIVVDKEKYAKTFTEFQASIPGYPDASFVTKYWTESRNPNDYLLNVKTSVSLWLDPKKDAENIDNKVVPSSEKSVTKGSYATNTTRTFHNVPLTFHSCKPLIGFPRLNPPLLLAERLFRYLQWMEDFADAHCLNKDISYLHYGCYMHLPLSPELNEQFPYRAGCYIQVPATVFYLLLPTALKDEWLKKFKALEHY